MCLLIETYIRRYTQDKLTCMGVSLNMLAVQSCQNHADDKRDLLDVDVLLCRWLTNLHGFF